MTIALVVVEVLSSEYTLWPIFDRLLYIGTGAILQNSACDCVGWEQGTHCINFRYVNCLSKYPELWQSFLTFLPV